MKKIRVVIAGGRKFQDYELLKRKMDNLLSRFNPEDIEIVSGCASGADTLGECYATERGIQIKRFPADWDNYGYAAGPIRNALMADYGTHCAVFWDGFSKGSHNMINVAKAAGLKVKVIRYSA